MSYSRLSHNTDLFQTSTEGQNINWYPGVQFPTYVWDARQKLKYGIDDFTTFMWRGCDAWENFGAFIIADKRGDLKFYNGPSFTNKYSSPQFSKYAGNLLGVDFKQQQISFKVGLYYFSIEDYQRFLDYIGPYQVDYLSFGFNPDWSYLVKLNSIQDSPRYILDKFDNETEITTETTKSYSIITSTTLAYDSEICEDIGHNWAEVFNNPNYGTAYYFSPSNNITTVLPKPTNISISGDVLTITPPSSWTGVRNCTFVAVAGNGGQIAGVSSSSVNIPLAQWNNRDETHTPTVNNIPITNLDGLQEQEVGANYQLTFDELGVGYLVVYFMETKQLPASYYYYTELTLKWDVQGPQQVRAVTPYKWEKNIFTNKSLYYIDNNQQISNLDTTFTIDIPLILNNETLSLYGMYKCIDGNINMPLFNIGFNKLSYQNIGVKELNLTWNEDTPTITEGWDIKDDQVYDGIIYVRSGNNPYQPIRIGDEKPTTIYAYQPEYYNGAGLINSELPSINNYMLMFHYDSESGLALITLGDTTLKLLSLTTSTITGKNLVNNFEVFKCAIPGQFSYPTASLTNHQIEISIEDTINNHNNELNNTIITCYARNNVI